MLWSLAVYCRRRLRSLRATIRSIDLKMSTRKSSEERLKNANMGTKVKSVETLEKVLEVQDVWMRFSDGEDENHRRK